MGQRGTWSWVRFFPALCLRASQRGAQLLPCTHRRSHDLTRLCAGLSGLSTVSLVMPQRCTSLCCCRAGPLGSSLCCGRSTPQCGWAWAYQGCSPARAALPPPHPLAAGCLWLRRCPLCPVRAALHLPSASQHRRCITTCQSCHCGEHSGGKLISPDDSNPTWSSPVSFLLQ